MYLLLACLIFVSPVDASAKTIVLKKGRNPYRRKALLDYKFVYLKQKHNHAIKPVEASLSSMNSGLSKIPRLSKIAQVAKVPSQQPSSKPLTNNESFQDPYDEDSWGDFSIEENLSVEARIKQIRRGNEI